MGHITSKSISRLKSMYGQARIDAESNTDEQAVKLKSLYPEWEDIADGESLEEGKRVNYMDVLYKVIVTHDKQSTWNPKDSASLFTPINESHSGTIEDPIPWVIGMVAENGRYYIDEDILYLCIESSGVGLYAQPKDLPRYFEAKVG